MMVDIALKTLFTRRDLFLMNNQKKFVLKHCADDSNDDISDDIGSEIFQADEPQSKFYAKLLEGTQLEKS